VGNLGGAWTGNAGYAAGKIGQAFSFDGASRVQAQLAYQGPFSVDLWVKAKSGSTAQYTSAVSSATNSQLTNTFEICFDNASSYEAFEGSSASPFTVLLGQASTTQLQHLAVTYDGSTVVTYLDGALANSGSAANAGVTLGFLVINFGVSREANYYQGLVDEVHMWSRALTAAEVLRLYVAGGVRICP
jgi:hypothetical protein